MQSTFVGSVIDGEIFNLKTCEILMTDDQISFIELWWLVLKPFLLNLDLSLLTWFVCSSSMRLVLWLKPASQLEWTEVLLSFWSARVEKKSCNATCSMYASKEFFSLFLFLFSVEEKKGGERDTHPSLPPLLIRGKTNALVLGVGGCWFGWCFYALVARAFGD